MYVKKQNVIPSKLKIAYINTIFYTLEIILLVQYDIIVPVWVLFSL